MTHIKTNTGLCLKAPLSYGGVATVGSCGGSDWIIQGGQIKTNTGSCLKAPLSYGGAATVGSCGGSNWITASKTDIHNINTDYDSAKLASDIANSDCYNCFSCCVERGNTEFWCAMMCPSYANKDTLNTHSEESYSESWILPTFGIITGAALIGILGWSTHRHYCKSSYDAIPLEESV